MALTKVQADGVNLGDDFAFTGDVTGAGLTSPFANSVTSTSEGGAVTTSIVQGLAKAWVKFTQVGTHTAADSFNLTSLTDNGTGNSTVTIANDLANANGPISVTSDNGSNFNNGAMGRMTAAGTASVRCSATTTAGASDKAHTQVIICGDLA